MHKNVSASHSLVIAKQLSMDKEGKAEKRQKSAAEDIKPLKAADSAKRTIKMRVKKKQGSRESLM